MQLQFLYYGGCCCCCPSCAGCSWGPRFPTSLWGSGSHHDLKEDADGGLIPALSFFPFLIRNGEPKRAFTDPAGALSTWTGAGHPAESGCSSRIIPHPLAGPIAVLRISVAWRLQHCGEPCLKNRTATLARKSVRGRVSRDCHQHAVLQGCWRIRRHSNDETPSPGATIKE